MYLTRCPECDAKVEVPDGDAVSVHCTACGHKIALRESEEEKERRIEKEKRKVRSKKELVNSYLELTIIFVGVPLSLLFLLLTCVFPGFFIAPLFAGFICAAIGFGKSCMLAAEEGNYVGFDYLESLGGIRWPIIILFFGFYALGFIILWEIAVVTCAVNKPKLYLPWIGLQVFGGVAFIMGFICAAIGAMIWSAL